jgi:hypothetical protein
MKTACIIIVGNPESVNGAVVSKWILKKLEMRVWAGLNSFRIKTCDKLL